MVQYDGIVFNLQSSRGISVLFSELISRLPRHSYELVGYRESPPPTLPDAQYLFERPRFMERYRRARVRAGTDLFHSTYYRLPAERAPKVVTTVYDFAYERFSSGIRKVVHVAQKGVAIAGADRLICISESTRRDLLEYKGARYADRAVVVPLAASDVYRPLPGTPRRPEVLYVGSRHASKNFQPVVEALATLTDLSLACVGGGDFKPEERALLERTLKGRYRHTGFLSVEALNVEYNRAVCLAYPSLFEGFGIPILEAMRAGCPVVAVNTSSIPEVAGDAAILLERGTADEIRHAIERLLVTETRDAFIAAGKVQAARFSWELMCERTVAVYEELLGRPLVRDPE